MEEALPMRHIETPSERDSTEWHRGGYIYGAKLSPGLCLSCQPMQPITNAVLCLECSNLFCCRACADRCIPCSDVHISHHPYGQPLECLRRPDFIYFLSQYLNSWDAESGSPGEKAVWVAYGSPGCRCHIKHSTYTEHICWVMWAPLCKLSFRAQVLSSYVFVWIVKW